MNLKSIIGSLVLVSIPLQGMGYAAYAQSTDPEFMRQLESALREKPEIVLEAAARAQERQRVAEMERMNVGAQTIRQELAVADNPGFILGNPKGKLTYVEYLDYRCGFCKKAHSEVNKLIAGNPEVRVVVVQLPVLGPQSEALARFAVAAERQGKFREVHDYLYENNVDATDAGFEKAAVALGLDWTKVKQDMTSSQTTGRLAANRELGEKLNVRGTPFFITPTTVVPGFTSAEDLASKAG